MKETEKQNILAVKLLKKKVVKSMTNQTFVSYCLLLNMMYYAYKLSRLILLKG